MDYPLEHSEKKPYTKRLKNQTYDYSDAIKINDIITTGFVKKLDIEVTDVDQKYNRGILVKTRFCQKIFFLFLKTMLEHCIETSFVFISPCLFPFSINIRPKTQMTINKTLVKKGVYKTVDLFESDFTLYEFTLRSAHLPKNNLGIRIGHTLYKTLVEKVNNGMKYTELNKFYMGDILPSINKMYPNLDEDIIKKIVKNGFYKINQYLKQDKEVFLKHINLSVQVIIYHPFKEYKKVV